MDFKASQIVPGKEFNILGASYVGNPRSNTAMFITKKVGNLLLALDSVQECLVFAEEGIDVPELLKEKHAFHFSKNPQLEYAVFANRFARFRDMVEKEIGFKQTPEGFFLFGDVKIPADAYIEPGCVIGPDVELGRNVRILANSVIRRATIGDRALINEHAVVGSNGFTMAENAEGTKIRIPTLGRVRIGNDVEVGSHDNISCGSGGDTVLGNNVKLDSLVHVGHDVHLCFNTEVTAGATLGGFVDVREGAYIGIGSVIRNRVTLERHCFIGMGSNVTKSVEESVVVAGNPARPFNK